MTLYTFNSNNIGNYNLPNTLKTEVNRITITETARTDTTKWHMFTLNKVPYKAAAKVINNINADVNLPQGTRINTLVSFNGGQSWETYHSEGAPTPSADCVDVVDTKTINIEGSRIKITSSSINESGLASYAFDGNINTAWSTSAVDKYLQIEFERPFKVKQLSITADRSYPAARTPMEWELLASNDGVNYDIICQHSDSKTWTYGEVRSYYTNPDINEYKIYRFKVNKSNTTNIASLTELKLHKGIKTHWQNVSINDIGTQGVPIQELNNIPFEHWLECKGAPNISLAIALNTEVISVSPSLKSLRIRSTSTGLETDENKLGPAERVGNENLLTKIEAVSIKHIASRLRSVHTPAQGYTHKILDKPISVRSQIGMQMLPSIFSYNNTTGFNRKAVEYKGVKYGVGWVESSPFKPRISPSYYHPAVYNGQKENSQPLL